MKRNSSAPPAGDNAFPMIMITLLVIIVLAVAVWLAYRYFAATPSSQSRAAMPPVQQLISENGELYGGLPHATGPDQLYEVLRNSAYVVGYSEKRRDPLWVAYHLAATTDHVGPKRPQRGFQPDNRTSAHVESRDYERCGYDRGHMCPSHAIGVHFGVEAQEGTFIMSNVVPQKHLLNAGVWEELEKEESDVYPNQFEEVWVIDGPIFHEPVRSLDSGVAIPDACYKIIIRLDHGHPHVLPVIMPQTVGHDHVINHFLTNVKQIEEATHLDFFTALPADERARVEQEQPAQKW